MNQELIASTFLEKSELDDNPATCRSEQSVVEPLVETVRLFTVPLT
jgi:hypothetical protein